MRMLGHNRHKNSSSCPAQWNAAWEYKQPGLLVKARQIQLADTVLVNNIYKQTAYKLLTSR